MVRPDARRGDDDLGPVKERTGRVEGCTVSASSRGLRGRHSTSNIPSTPSLFATGMYYDTGAPESSIQLSHISIRSRPPLPSHRPHTPVLYDIYGSSHPLSQPPPALYDPYIHAPSVRPHIPYRSKVQEPLNEFSGPGRNLGAEFFEQLVGEVLPIHHTAYMITHPLIMMVHDDNDNYDDGDDARDEEEPVPLAPVAHAAAVSSSDGSRNKRPDKARDVTTPTQKKKSKSSDWEQTEGGPIDPVLIQSYGENVDRGLLKSRSCYIVLTGWTLSDPEVLFDVTTDPRSRLSSSDMTACYIQYLLGSLLFTDKSGNIVPAKLWLLLKDVRSCRGFA
ncbi:hypothetical protein M9H77_21850 [Catharanthus roseus]|uniref:Uncharacterized protein n=1 Tax=Catharanthus roseus TaxID=4058 RepID=A0ACC0AQ03_CATRO|nr:hypothetical protein M9H77_21850 [Catharanthus roseus]